MHHRISRLNWPAARDALRRATASLTNGSGRSLDWSRLTGLFRRTPGTAKGADPSMDGAAKRKGRRRLGVRGRLAPQSSVNWPYLRYRLRRRAVLSARQADAYASRAVAAVSRDRWEWAAWKAWLNRRWAAIPRRRPDVAAPRDRPPHRAAVVWANVRGPLQRSASAFGDRFNLYADRAVVRVSRERLDWPTLRRRIRRSLLSSGKGTDWSLARYRIRRTGTRASLAVRRYANEAAVSLSEMIRPLTITLSFEDDVLRMLVIRGRQVVAWGTAAPEDGPLRKEGTDRRPEHYAASIRQFLQAHGIRRCRVVTELPLYSSMLRHLDLPDIPKGFLEQVVTSEVEETIPFNAGEVDIAWRVRREGSEQKLFAIAVPKAVMDDHVRVLDEAGFRPTATYSKAVALAFASGTPDAISIHLTSSQASIVLVRDGMPQVVNQLALPDEVSAEDQAQALVGAIEQIAGYYLEYQVFDPLDESRTMPVVVTGLSSEEGPLAEALQQVMLRDMLPRTPRLVYPDDFSASEYVVNLGLAQAAQATAATGLFRRQDTSVNLLPARHLPRPLPALPIGVFGVLLALGAASFLLTGEVQAKETEEADLADRLSRAERMYTIGVNRDTRTSQEAEKIRGQVGQLETRLFSLRRDVETILARMKALEEGALTYGVNIPSLSPQADQVIIGGTAGSYDQLLKYLKELRESELFEDVVVESVRGLGPANVGTEGQDSEVETGLSFQIKVLIAIDAGEEAEGGD
ncbi:MAG: hypothetical protein IH956_03375 [Chloroflexi bacterium]|nr:hypothetical protein [Chloroflexota bacterium]